MPFTGREMYIDIVYLPMKSSGVVAHAQVELRIGSYMDCSTHTVHVSIEQMIPLIWRVVLS